MMPTDRYTKAVLTVIAVALVVLAASPWVKPVDWRGPDVVGRAEAQDPPAVAPAAPPEPAPSPTPAPAPPAGSPRPRGALGPMPPRAAANAQRFDDCTAVSSETVPAAWGRLVALGPGLFFFESDDMIRLVRTAPYEAVPPGPNQKPCRVLEIKKVR